MTAGTLPGGLATAQERKLASGVFGHADDIRRTATAYYRGLGRLCAHRCGVTGLDAAAAPQLESLRRGTLDSALRAFLAGDDDEGRRVVAEYLDLPRTHLGADTRSADLPHALRGWRGDPVGEEVVARFNASMASASDAAVVTAVAPTPEHDAALGRTLSTLDRALPLLGAETVRSVAGVGLFEGAMGSGYYAGTPLLIFVNAGVFADEAEAAEIVLHESLHQKLADIGVAREILRRGYVDEQSHRIPVPWGGDREFSVDRALAAYHVYTHQTVLYLSLLGHGDLVPQGPAVLARRLATSWARARHFAAGTATPGARAELGLDGRRFTSWLAEVVEELGGAVLPDGSPLRAHADAVHG
ncbi:hypothetical protein GCM10010492_53100 [Saccharothrix mutabilis subsp. mutabilis]|uniref:HEXXH motif domain-containing protein n=1 Tax=Saccharothrix mutabilis subsp. mutabilis TaxID=66855 RepID=A0ABP3E193_9PSEU